MNLWFDLKYAARLLNKSRGYSLMCASVVALSVGLAVWTGALAYSQMFKPLGFPGSERWYSVQIAADATARARPGVDAYTYQELLKHNRSADHLGAFANQAVVLSEGEATTSLRGAAVSPRLLAAARVAPILGRTFDESDGRTGAAAVAILGFDAWQNYFAGDSAIVGKTARIDAAPVQIIGVMPRDPLVFDDYEVWLPLRMPVLARPHESAMTLFPLIVLRENQNLDSILSEMKPVVADVNGDHPKLFNAARSVALIPAHRMFTHNVTPIIAMMSLMAAGVLLLGGVNISMMFLARLLERSRELALRTALGASRPRLLRQCLLETALIVLLGLVAGYGLAALGVRWTHGISGFMEQVLATGRSTNLPVMRPFDLLVAVISAVAVWLLSTLIPAWRISRQDAAVVLAGSGKGASVRGSNKSVGLLVGLQVVISCLVLVTCGNVVLAVHNETNKPNGLTTAQVMVSTFPTVFDARFSDATLRLRYWEDLAAAIANKVPGAEVAFTTAPPTRPVRVPATIETQQGTDDRGTLTLPLTVVSENYFNLMGVTLRSGRLFDSTDNSASLNVAIVDEKMAARYWPDQDVLGKRVQLNSTDNAPWLTIVGVVSSVPGAAYRPDADIGSIYRPLRQAVPPAFQVLVKLPRTAAEPRAALRAAAFSVDRDLPLHNLQMLDDYLAAIKLSSTAMIPVFTAIALITALLAASGLFGLISRSVAQRTQEVGIRRALGATTWRATSMFLRQGALYLSVAIVGLGLGVMVMPLLSRVFPNILDHAVPVTAGVVLLMAAVISTASYLPPRCAVALEPGDALRYD
ncbi:MAG TPA: ABC transporter permease [Thermoanaerobaculia bacterium]|nr:ABC transporter permease [Thermoanaerobaculia bacterium]